MKSRLYEVIKSKLGPFLFNFDEKQFKMSLFNGNINLTELVIRPDKINEVLEK